MPPSLGLPLLLASLLVAGTWGAAAAAAAASERPEVFPNQDELILDVHEPLNLTCRAAQPVAWCTDHKFTEKNYEELYEKGHAKPYISTLAIDAVNTSHVGYFSCVFNTSENKEKNNCNVSDPSITSLYLYVKDPAHLMVKQSRPVLHAMVGEAVLVPCKPTFPEVNITLSKDLGDDGHMCDGCDYDPREGYTMWVYQSLYYIFCTGIYGDNEDYFDLQILVQDPATKPPSQPRVNVEGAWQEDNRNDLVVYYVREGTTVNLTCTYDFREKGSSHWKLEWSSSSLNETGTHRIWREYNATSKFKSRYYEINDATLRDSGIYSCTTRIHQLYSEPSQLNISVVASDAEYLSTSIFHPNVTEVEDNLPVQWEILFIAHPRPDFKWKQQGKLLRDSTTTTSRDQYRNYEMNVTMQEGSLSLYLHHPTVADNGKYTLEASLPGTDITSTTTMFLMIPGKPQNVQILSSNDKHMFKEGERFSLTCTAQGYPKPDLKLHFTPYESTAATTQDGRRVYNQLEEENQDDKTSVVERNVHWMGVAEVPGRYQCLAENEMGTDKSLRKMFLVTDGELPLAISLQLEIDGAVQSLADKTVTVVEGDDLKLTCRANKVSAKAPLTWTLNNRPLDNTAEQMWGIETREEQTRLSIVSTLRARSLPRAAANFSITCRDKAGNHTSLVIHIEEMEPPTWRGTRPGGDYDSNKNDNLTLSCPADGNPPPKVIWKKGPQTLVTDNRRKVKNNYHLFFEILSPTDTGTYTCEVSNKAGQLSSHPFNVRVRDPDVQKTTVILAVVGVLIAALVVLSVFFCRKIYQARKETLNLQLREQKMFMEGDPSSLNPDIPLEQQAELLPYNTKYEVSRDSIIFDKLLGAGAFGRVYRATALHLLPGEARTTVAVKMIKSRTDCAQLKALRSEVKIMIHIGRHINIVNLLGACSKDLASKGELLLLVEYCKHGNILDYMRRHRREFVNQINDEDKIDPTFWEPRPRHRSDSSSRSHTSRGIKYAHLNFHQDNVFYGTDHTSDAAAATAATASNFLPHGRSDLEGACRPFRARTMSASSSRHHVASDGSFLPSETSAGTTDGYLSAQSLNSSQAPICSTHLLEWAYQIAKGMEYLAFKKVLHGDLAARNVLLAENNVVKISDFGLAKDIYKNDYKKRSSGPMPVKWLAVECLRDGVFSTQSDVWSFGVVLWEIFSLGQIPYSCTEFDESFILKLEKGVRLEQPRYATYGLYRLMLECWNSDPMERPSFTSVEASLGEMLGETQRQNYLQIMEPYQHDNEVSELLELLPSQDYSAKVRHTTPPRTEDGYEMPFSPGVPPHLMAQVDRLSTASRLTSRQMEYLRSVEDEDASTSYLPMSADRTDDRTVFDFDNETVANINGQPEHENEDTNLYLKMDKTPQRSPEPDTLDGVPKRHRVSPQRIVLQSVSSQESQRGRHPEVRKHDSGVYSPTVLTQTNPGYMAMNALLSTDEHNYINTTDATEANSRVYAYGGHNNHAKAREYRDDSKCSAEYANLLPYGSGCDPAESETSSGVGSIEGGSPPRVTEMDKITVPPIPEEAIVV